LDHLDEVLEIQEALSKLPPELRGVVHLYYFEGLPAKQIAEALHLSEAAVHSRLHRARKQLETFLGGD
jgi:RNA polymerase sigma-70 factor (ECF subfamily)